MANTQKPWTPQEDINLTMLSKSFAHNWYIISKFLPDRDQDQCQQRYKIINPNNQKLQIIPDRKQTTAPIFNKNISKIQDKKQKEKQKIIVKWTIHEDGLLLRLYKMYPDQWVRISNELKNKSHLQCKYRYSRLKKMIRKSDKKEQKNESQEQSQIEQDNQQIEIIDKDIHLRDILKKKQKKQITIDESEENNGQVLKSNNISQRQPQCYKVIVKRLIDAMKQDLFLLNEMTK